MDDLFEIASIFVALAVLVAALFGVMHWLDSASCRSRYEAAGWKTQYGFFTGCLVDRGDGKLVPHDMLREIVD